jgi:hypothetical protein
MRANLIPLIAGCVATLGIAFAIRSCAEPTNQESGNGSHRSPHADQGIPAQAADSPPASASKRTREPESDLTRIVREKLEAIIIPKVDFEGTTAEEAIDFLRHRVVELDPEPDYRARGMAFHVNRPKDSEPSPSTSPTSVDVSHAGHDFKADNISAWQLLKRIASDNRMRIEVTERGVELTSIDPAANEASKD